METSGVPHASAALPLGTEPLVSIEQEAVWGPQPGRTFRRTENTLKLP